MAVTNAGLPLLEPALQDRAPVVDDARAAARAIAERVPGVDRIMLYGSVARGEAVPGSDIDLVVVFGDIDYADRRELGSECWAAAGGVRHPIGLMITDRHEWAIRSGLLTTIERSIAEDHVELHSRPASSNGERLGGRQLEVPVSDIGEAYRRLGECARAGLRIAHALRPADAESEAAAEGDPNGLMVAELRKARYRNIVTECDLFLELSLKVMHHAVGDTPPKYQHHLAVLLTDLPATPETRRVQDALSKLRVELLPAENRDENDTARQYTNWRSHGTYDLPSKAAKYLPPSRVNDYLDAVTEVSAVLLEVPASRSPGGVLAESDNAEAFLFATRHLASQRSAYELESGPPGPKRLSP